MRYLFGFYFLFNCCLAFGQNNLVKDGNLVVSMNKAKFHFDIMGYHKKKYSEDGKTVDVLADLLVEVEIDGFDEKNKVDFNNFSIVEHEHKLRQRPYYVWFDGYFIQKYKLGEENCPDNFLAYSQVQNGIEDYDHYLSEELFFNIEKSFKQRFYLLCIEAKKNKKKLFLLTIPVKVQNKGEFSLYYKDQLVKTFMATKKWKKID